MHWGFCAKEPSNASVLSFWPHFAWHVASMVMGQKKYCSELVQIQEWFGFSPLWRVQFIQREKRLELATWKTMINGTRGWGTFLGVAGHGVGRAAALTNGQCLLLFKSPELKPKKSYTLKIGSSAAKGIRVIAATEYVVP